MRLGLRKTPDPMTVPTTSAVAITGPSARTRPEGDSVFWLMHDSVIEKCDRDKRFTLKEPHTQ